MTVVALRKYHDKVSISSIKQVGKSLVIGTDRGLIEIEWNNGTFKVITDTIKEGLVDITYKERNTEKTIKNIPSSRLVEVE